MNTTATDLPPRVRDAIGAAVMEAMDQPVSGGLLRNIQVGINARLRGIEPPVRCLLDPRLNPTASLAAGHLTVSVGAMIDG